MIAISARWTLALALAIGLGAGLPASGAVPSRPNVLVFFIDTLRADHAGCYGYKRPTTPTLDALASTGTLFENAISQATWSLPSYATIFTSTYPSTHGVTGQTDALGPELPTLAGIVSACGYQTAAFVGGGHVGPKFGFARGFGVYDSRTIPSSVAVSVGNAIRWLDGRAPAPFLLFVQGYDAHAPYLAPLGFGEMYDPDYSGVVHEPGFLSEDFLLAIGENAFDPCLLAAPARARSEPASEEASSSGWRPGPGGLPPRIPSMRRELTDADRSHVIAHYDGAVTYADACLARMLDALAARKLLEKTIVIVAGDHGETLFERGHLSHAGPPFEELIHVPLVVSGPGVAKARRVPDVVGLIDLAPTVLDLCGITACHEHQGRSLAAHVSSSAPPPIEPEGLAVSSNGRSLSARTRQWHLLQRRPGAEAFRELQLYDIRADPAETRNLASERPEVVKELYSRLQDWSEQHTAAVPKTASMLDRLQLQMMRSFGYW